MGLNPTARRNAALFMTVSLVAGFGGTAMTLTAGVWVMSLTGDPGLAAMTTACLYVPALAGPALGALADRVPRRPLLIRTCLAIALGLLTLLAVRGPGQVWLILTVMLGYGAALTVVDAAEAGLLPAALPADALGAVNGLRMSAQEGVKLVSPLAGAGLFTLAGARPVIVLSAALLATAALLYAALHLPRAVVGLPRVVCRLSPFRLLRAVPGRRAPRDARAASEACGAAGRHGDAAGDGGRGDDRRDGWWSAWAVGAGHLRRRPGLGAIVLVAALAMAGAGLATGVLYAMIDDGLGRAPAFAGVLGAVQGAGTIAGGLLTGRILAARPRRTGGETLLAALGTLLLAIALLLRAIPWLPAVVAGSLIAGVGLPWAIVAAFTAVQRGTPEAALGRVSATAGALIFTMPALATPAGAALLHIGGYQPVLITAAALTLTAALLLLTRRAPFHPAD